MMPILMPRPAVGGKPTPAWQTTFNSGVIQSNKTSVIYGYQRSPLIGSISDGTIDLLSGALINAVKQDAFDLYLIVNNALANSGWSHLFLGTEVYNRADAVYTGGGPTTWKWTRLVGDPLPFDTADTNILLGMA